MMNGALFCGKQLIIQYSRVPSDQTVTDAGGEVPSQERTKREARKKQFEEWVEY